MFWLSQVTNPLKLITEYSNLGSSSQGIAWRYVLIIGYEKSKIGGFGIKEEV